MREAGGCTCEMSQENILLFEVGQQNLRMTLFAFNRRNQFSVAETACCSFCLLISIEQFLHAVCRIAPCSGK